MSTNGECPTCCEFYTSQQRKKIECTYCNYESCRQCIKTYTVGQSAEPHCMNCSKPFTRSFLTTELGITFIKTTYRDKRKDLLHEIEKSKLPGTMDAARRYKHCQDYECEIKRLQEERAKLRELEGDINSRINKMNSKIYKIRWGNNNEDEKKKRNEFTRPCVDEKCNGFMSSQWKCGICKKFGCPKCHEVVGINRDDHHVCDEDTVKTVAAIKSETRPCPKCYCPIFKISGCDQMWCTQCEVAFSWKTGDVQRGLVHNPHYYEAQRKLGISTRNPGDVVCGGLVRPYDLVQGFLPFLKKRAYLRNYLRYEDDMTKLERMITYIYAIVHRSVTHNIYVLDTLRADIRSLSSTENIRIRYIVGEKTEDEMKDDVFRNSEKAIKKRRLCDIFETYINVMIENVNAMLVEATSTSSCITFHAKLMELVQTCIKIRNYAEMEFLKLGEEYRQATYVFQDNWELIYKRIPGSVGAAGWESVRKRITDMENGKCPTLPNDCCFMDVELEHSSGGGAAVASGSV